MNRIPAFISATAAVVFCVASPFAATVSVERAVQYQTIVGFGSFSSINPWRVQDGPFWVEVDLDAVDVWGMLAQDFSVIRTNNHFPSDKLSKLVAAGLDQFIISVWSPPAYMKDNNDVNHGGHLLPEYYDDYALYCVDFVKRFENEVGVAPLALSLQNELRFSEPYESCIYTQATFRDLLKVAGPILDSACPDLQIYAPEDMSHTPGLLLSFPGAAEQDPESAGFIDIVASHGYGGDGVTPGETGPDAWNQIYEFSQQFGMTTWMSETSGYPNTWEGAMDVAMAMYGSLKFGKISLWTWWTLTGDLIPDGGPCAKYAMHAQYGRYVRPGAVMVECTSDDAEVLSVAFDDAANARLTLVLTNISASPKTVTITGDQLPGTYNLFQTTDGSLMQDAGTAGAASVSLPASSITTLYATVPALGTSPVPATTAFVEKLQQTGITYGLDGSVVRTRPAAGVYLGARSDGTVVGRRVLHDSKLR